MRKRFVFFYAFFCLTLTIIAIYYAKQLDKAKEIENEEKDIQEKIANITKYIEDNNIKENIKVEITSTGEIKEMSVKDYLLGVLPSEMPPEYDIEALKAQAVVARTYLYNKMGSNAHKGADICDNPSHCQAFYTKEQILKIWEKSKKWDEEERNYHWEKVEKAVKNTENIAVTYKDQYIKAYFHACSGGKTENVSNIWGKQNISYLVSVESPGEENYKNYTSVVKLSISSLQEKLNEDSSTKCSISQEGGDIVEILSYTDTGRVDKVKIGGVIYKAETLRTVLGLKSTNFTVEYKDEEVIFNVTGYGHGVGMSQVGANYYASQGYSFDEIIKHYYTGVDVTYINKEETNENKI